MILFEFKRIIIRQDKDALKDQKLLQFCSLKSVRLGDNLQGDCPMDGDDEFRHQLILSTKERDFTLYCRTDLERQLWLENFQKAILIIQDPRGLTVRCISVTQ